MIDYDEPGPGHWNPRVIVLRGALAIALLSAAIALIVSANPWPAAVIGLVMLAAYCALAYIFQPRPDYSDLGLFGGLVDHPFRWSDNFNRSLVAARFLMAPGRFAIVSVRDLITLARGRRVIVLSSRDGDR